MAYKVNLFNVKGAIARPNDNYGAYPQTYQGGSYEPVGEYYECEKVQPQIQPQYCIPEPVSEPEPKCEEPNKETQPKSSIISHPLFTTLLVILGLILGVLIVYLITSSRDKKAAGGKSSKRNGDANAARLNAEREAQRLNAEREAQRLNTERLNAERGNSVGAFGSTPGSGELAFCEYCLRNCVGNRSSNVTPSSN